MRQLLLLASLHSRGSRGLPRWRGRARPQTQSCLLVKGARQCFSVWRRRMVPGRDDEKLKTGVGLCPEAEEKREAPHQTHSPGPPRPVSLLAMPCACQARRPSWGARQCLLRKCSPSPGNRTSYYLPVLVSCFNSTFFYNLIIYRKKNSIFMNWARIKIPFL